MCMILLVICDISLIIDFVLILFVNQTFDLERWTNAPFHEVLLFAYVDAFGGGT